jgi:PAS domain S-box-containing protein
VVCFVNPSAEVLFGRSAEELTGEVFGFPVADGETTEIDVLCKGNRIRSAEMRVVETSWSGEVAYLASLRDITDRKQVEAEIRRLNSVLERRISERTTQLAATNHELQNEISERKSTEQMLKNLTEQLTRSRNLLRTIFDSVDDGLLLLDNQGHVLALNQSLALLLGGNVPELVEQPWSVLCQRTDPPFPGMWVLKTLRDGRARLRREQHCDAEAPPRMLHMQALPILTHDNRLDQVVVHVVDVTEQLQWEHLAIQNERFVASDRLAAAMAHEVNTPLQSIQNCLYLAEKSSEARRDSYLSLARDEIDRISRIVQRLLDLHHPVPDTGQMIDINALIERLVLLTGSTLARHGIEVVCHLEHDLPSLWGQHDQLTQVLLNMILNAMDAMPDGGRLVLRTSTHLRSAPTETGPLARRWLTIEISDTGSGISAAHQERIFEPFFTTKSEGSGLGLAISHKIILQHGGDVTVQSTLEEGTTFTMVFPLTEA